MTTNSQLFWRTIAHSVTSRFAVDQLCSTENRIRCMKRLLKMPEINFYADSVKKTAAILLPLCVYEDRLSLLYTVRSANLSRHSNEVSFPGGIRDDTDDSYTACAIREAFEECGLQPDQIDVHFKYFIHYKKIKNVFFFFRYGAKVALFKRVME